MPKTIFHWQSNSMKRVFKCITNNKSLNSFIFKEHLTTKNICNLIKECHVTQHDNIQHNDNQYNDTRHNNTIPLWWKSLCSHDLFIAMLNIIMLSVVMLSVVAPSKCRYSSLSNPPEVKIVVEPLKIGKSVKSGSDIKIIVLCLLFLVLTSWGKKYNLVTKILYF
jgi:hypothetical protein